MSLHISTGTRRLPHYECSRTYFVLVPPLSHVFHDVGLVVKVVHCTTLGTLDVREATCEHPEIEVFTGSLVAVVVAIIGCDFARVYAFW